MILPIRIYGDPALRAKTYEVDADSEDLQQLIDDMHETLRGAEGIGLAAPQVGRTERVFLVDLRAVVDESENSLPPQPMVFINPSIAWESDDDGEFEEGCLSIPDVREMVIRPDSIQMWYLDRDFEPHHIKVGGLLARVIQHEYDHLEGVLFIDLITPFRRSLIRRRLREMTRGNVEADYLVAGPVSKGARW